MDTINPDTDSPSRTQIGLIVAARGHLATFQRERPDPDFIPHATTQRKRRNHLATDRMRRFNGNVETPASPGPKATQGNAATARTRRFNGNVRIPASPGP